VKSLVALFCFTLSTNQFAVPERLLGMLKRELGIIRPVAAKSTREY
jgi:hypothetical protein